MCTENKKKEQTKKKSSTKKEQKRTTKKRAKKKKKTEKEIHCILSIFCLFSQLQYHFCKYNRPAFLYD